MRWSRILPPRICAARASDCGNRWIPSEHFVGPALAIGLMWLTGIIFKPCSGWRSFRHFWPWDCYFLQFMSRNALPGCARCDRRFSLAELKRLGRAYWWVVGIAVVFSLARFSEAFLILRAQVVGLALDARANGFGADECRLCLCCVPRRSVVRPRQSHHGTWDGLRNPGCCGPCFCVYGWTHGRGCRCGIVGIAYGVHARTAGDTYR